MPHKAETGNAPHTDQWTGEIASRAAYRIDRQDCAPSRCSTEPTNQEWLAIGMHAGIGTPVSEATSLDELDAFLACCAHYQFTIYHRLVERSRRRVTPPVDFEYSSILDYKMYTDKIDSIQLTTMSLGNRALLLCLCRIRLSLISHPHPANDA